jgi:cyclic pyranopterin monophosphate synthase
VTRQKPIDAKAVTLRTAVAAGELRLSPSGRAAFRRRRTDKGDPRAAAELAGLLAMKRTPELIPHCHPVPLTGSEVTVRPTRSGVRVTARAEAIYRTGVEMEALVGATVALLTVWDMVKELEKDGEGQYPNTRLGPVRVVSKRKVPVTA